MRLGTQQKIQTLHNSQSVSSFNLHVILFIYYVFTMYYLIVRNIIEIELHIMVRYER